MIDEFLWCRFLPGKYLISGLTQGLEPNIYEKYLVEFLNNSIWFREKVKFEEFEKAKEESHGECDCSAGYYQIDFKLLAATTHMHALRELSPQQITILPGVTAECTPRRDGSMRYVSLKNALKEYDSVEKLIKMHEEKYEYGTAEFDVKTFINILETKKNLLFFYPVEFYFEKNYAFIQQIHCIEKALKEIFTVSIQYREKAAGNFETYLSFMFNQMFVIMNCSQCKFKIIDYVCNQKSPTYKKLNDYYPF